MQQHLVKNNVIIAKCYLSSTLQVNFMKLCLSTNDLNVTMLLYFAFVS